MEVTLETLGKTVGEQVAAAISPLAERFEKALEDVKNTGTRKDLEKIHGEEIVDRAIIGGNFLRDVALGKAIDTDIMNTDTSAGFGYSVPTEILPDVIGAAVQESLALKHCTTFPQRAQTVHRLVYSSGYTMTFPDETQSPSISTGSYDRKIFTKKRGNILVACTNDLLQGSVVDMYNEFIIRFGGVYGTTVDTYAFNDNTSPFTGILSGAGNSVTMAGTDTLLTGLSSTECLDDLEEMIGTLSAAVNKVVWVMSPTVKMKLRGIMRDGDNNTMRDVWERRQSGDDPDINCYLLDIPVLVSDVMPASSACDVQDKAVLFLGNLADYHIGKADDFAIKSSPVANENVDGTQVSAFSSDSTFFLGQAKWSQNIALTASFVKYETSAS